MYASESLDWVQRAAIILELSRGSYDNDLRFLLSDESPVQQEITLHDPRTSSTLEVLITCRRLGEDTGKDILVDLGPQLRDICEAQRRATRQLTPEELEKVQAIQRHFDPERR